MSSKRSIAEMSTALFDFTREDFDGNESEDRILVCIRYSYTRVATIVFEKRASLYLNNPFGVDCVTRPIATAFVRRHERFAPSLMRYFQECLLAHIENMRYDLGSYFFLPKELTQRLENYDEVDRREDWFRRDDNYGLSAAEFAVESEFTPTFLQEKPSNAIYPLRRRLTETVDEQQETKETISNTSKNPKRPITFSPPSPNYADEIERSIRAEEEAEAAREKTKKRKAASEDVYDDLLNELDDYDAEKKKSKENEQKKKQPVAEDSSNDDDHDDVGESPSKFASSTLLKKTPIATNSNVKRVPGAPMLRKTRSTIEESSRDDHNNPLPRKKINFSKPPQDLD